MPMPPELLKKLSGNTGNTLNVVGWDPAFDYYAVTAALTVGQESPLIAALEYVRLHPGEQTKKKMPVIEYELVEVNDTLYWRRRRPPATLQLPQLMRGDIVPSGTIAQLAPDSIWYVATAINETVIANTKRYFAENAGATPVKQFPVDDATVGHTLVLIPGIQTLYWKRPNVTVAAAGPLLATEPLLGLTNNDRLWLTYETIFNQRLYRKTNQRLQLGLYRIPLKCVKVFVRDRIQANVLTQLVAAFFPDLTPDVVQTLSLQTRKWKTLPKTFDIHCLSQRGHNLLVGVSLSGHFSLLVVSVPEDHIRAPDQLTSCLIFRGRSGGHPTDD